MTEYDRLVYLSWRILEMKMVYYRPELTSKRNVVYLSVSDAEYDALEDEYRKLCTKLGKEPTAADMVGFDVNRACCKIVIEKYRGDV